MFLILILSIFSANNNNTYDGEELDNCKYSNNIIELLVEMNKSIAKLGTNWNESPRRSIYVRLKIRSINVVIFSRKVSL